MKCAILTTDTKHHRYFVNRMATSAQTYVVLEQEKPSSWQMYWKAVRRRRSPWALVDNPYLRVGLGAFCRREDAHEERFFALGIPHAFTGIEDLATFGTVNDPTCVNFLKALAPDVIVSFGTGIIRKPLLALPGHKINVHRGILPRYRGLDSDLWALYLGDFDNIGVTIHTLQPRLDTGGILRQARLPLSPTTEAHHFRYETTLIATELVESILDDLSRGAPLHPIEQDLSAGHYYSYIPPLKRIVALRRLARATRGLRDLARRPRLLGQPRPVAG